MRYARWFVCVGVGHTLIGPRKLHDPEGTFAFYGWHCSRCLIRVASTRREARLPKRSGFAVILRGVPFELVCLWDRVRYAIGRLRRRWRGVA